MTENIDIYLVLKINIENDNLEFVEEVFHLGRRIQLPYVPQINSMICVDLHNGDYGRKKFKVRDVNTPLGYYTNKPMDEKRFDLVELTEVMTENTYKLSDLLKLHNFDNLDDLCEKCKQYGWSVLKGVGLQR